ncbi:hypothetical protein SUGI_0000310 [Cryptomeria japonica]|nr:hypothetical protein SUGI_0000310 [Cryptomeria japonica]
MELITCGKMDFWRDKEQIFRLDGVVPFFTSHLMVPFAHQLVDWEDILSKGWFPAELETLEKIFPALDMSRCVWDDHFLCCSSCSSSWMLISLKSDLKSFVSDLGGCWCTIF